MIAGSSSGLKGAPPLPAWVNFSMNRLRKQERLHGKSVIERIFTGGVSKSFSIYPLRVVYMPVEEQEACASVLVSVSKKRFKRAVKRNRVKRQIREAYRKNKQPLLERLEEEGKPLAIAFIYLSNELIPSAVLEEKMKLLLTRLAEKRG